MGRKRNNPQSERKEESPERLLNKIEATKLSDIKFKIMVIRMLKELSENFKELQGSIKELTMNYNSMKKDIENINKTQEEMKNIISKMKNTVKGIKNRLDKAEDQNRELDEKVQKNSQTE